jgi:hypothetical protein
MITFHTRWLLAIATVAMLGVAAGAQETPPPAESAGAESPEAAALRQEAIGQFDLNDDGALTGDEVGRARAFLQALRSEVGDRVRQRGRGGDRRPIPAREPRGDNEVPLPELTPPQPGEPGPAPPRPPREGRRGPMATFERFDADGDGLLNRDEFLGFWNSLGDRPGRIGPPDGRRFGGPGGPRGPAFGRPAGEGGGDRRDAGPGDDRRTDRLDRERRRDRDRGGPPRGGDPALDEAPPFEPGPPADRPPADEPA